MNDLPIDIPQLLRDLDALAAHNEPGAEGWTRRAFTPAFVAGRQWLSDSMRQAGLTPQLDPAANLIGTRPGTFDLPPLVIGSHSDTVAGGGRFDGVLGVLAGLAVARALEASGTRLRHPLQVVDFLAEEPTPYGACLGSAAMAGALPDEALARTDADGRTLAEALAFVGGQPAELELAARGPGDIAAYLELHIEQGPVLEQLGVPIGVVQGIVGIRRAWLHLAGRPDHAGTTPMGMRHDALAAAAEVVLAAEQAAQSHAHAVATVGALQISPGHPNVVPGAAVLSVEVRSLDWPTVEHVWTDMMQAAEIACAARGVSLRVADLEDVAPMHTPDWLIATLDAVCQPLAPNAPRLPSGAGHDGSWVGTVAPVGMIFVRSRGGRSHCAEEYSAPEDIALGVQALARALLALDEEPGMRETGR